MAIRKLGIAGTMVLCGILLYGSVAIAMGIGLVTHRSHSAAENTSTVYRNTATPKAPAGTLTQGSAPAYNTSADNVAASSSLVYPFPGPGAFEPGPPPNYSANSGDGLSAWGVAFKQTNDTNAKVDAALIKSAYQDAQKRAQELAAATGISLGKLVAMSDYTNAQPFYKPCVVPQGKPVPPSGGPSGGASSSNGSSGSGTAIAEPAPAIAPVPAPSPCAQTRYLVAWVTVRYAIA